MTEDYEVDENGRITIDVSGILTGEVSIRKTAKKFGLRRDDLINRIKEALKEDEEAIRQLDFIVAMNKIIFDDLTLEDAAKELDMEANVLDQKILATLIVNQDKLQRYIDKKDGVQVKKDTKKVPNKNQKNFNKRNQKRGK